jgi:hypothetical protein
LFGVAYVGLLRGDLATMRARLEDSLQLTRHLIQPWGIAWAEFSLGVVSIMNGDTRAAVIQVTESLEQRWSIRDARGLRVRCMSRWLIVSCHKRGFQGVLFKEHLQHDLNHSEPPVQ